jgi:hypothetical protein
MKRSPPRLAVTCLALTAFGLGFAACSIQAAPPAAPAFTSPSAAGAPATPPVTATPPPPVTTTPATIPARSPTSPAARAAGPAHCTGAQRRFTAGPKTGGDFETYTRLTNVRAGRHECFDRLVVDLKAGQEYYDVRYVDQVRQPEDGPVVPLRGGARLAIFAQMHAWDSTGRPTYRPANPAELVDVTGWRTFRQVALAGSFEYGTQIGLGLRARLPFRAFTLPGPTGDSQLVIDVAHRW